jgi:DNA helicase-2/ATP-dependent DNA helicase PcrA
VGKLDERKLLENILTIPTELSEEQKKAVLATEKQVKIVAGAGAGKTETLTRRIVYLLLINKVHPSEIVAFTFTEKAAQSLKSRIYQRVEELGGKDVSSKLGEMFIGTIHGYAKRLLDDHFGFGKYGVLDENQEIAFLMRHGFSLNISSYGRNYADSCSNFLRAISMVWDEMLDENALKSRAKTFYGNLKSYERILNDHCQITFGRMMNFAAVNLLKRPEVVRNVKHLIVDEYQDINKSQSTLIETIGLTAELFVVGDPRQSIYQWRGSNEGFFTKFAEKHPGLNERTIRENRRSGRKIVHSANRFAESFESAAYEPMEATREDSGYTALAENETAEDEATWVVDQIENLVKSNGLTYGDIGILMRSVTTSAVPLIDEMRARRIPFIVGGKAGLFRKSEAQALGRIFVWMGLNGFWVENPWKWNEQIAGDALVDTALTQWSEAVGGRVPSDAREKLDEIKRDVLDPCSKIKNFTAIYQRVLTALGFHSLNHEDKNDAAIMANLGRFNELLTDFEIANRLGGRQPSWAHDFKSLCWYINSYAMQAYGEGEADDVRGVDAVNIMTVHQAKGLEWPVVFVTALSDRRFPSKNVGKPRGWCDIPRDLFDASRYEGSIEDERRLFYVAITRARDALVLSYFKRKTNSLPRSPFIDDINPSDFSIVGGRVGIPNIKVKSQTTDQEMLTFSAGEIISYARCPYDYLLGNLWGYQPGLSQGLGYGNSLHHCLRRASEMVKNEGINPASAIATAVDEDFFMPYAGGKVFEDFKNKARETLLKFADNYTGDFGRIEEVEYRLEFPIHGASITGRVDVLLRDGETFEVRDYKTSEEARTFDETSTQVQLYSLGLNNLGKQITKGSVAYLEEAAVREVIINEKTLGFALSQAEGRVHNIRDCRFQPKAGDWCKNCDRESICRWR